MPGYAYHGDQTRETDEAWDRALRKPRKHRAQWTKEERGMCGTSGGRDRHRRRGEDICPPCRYAFNAQAAFDRGYKPTGRRNNQGDHCGTPYGYQLHVARGETSCFRCRVAAANRRNQYQKTGRGHGGDK